MSRQARVVAEAVPHHVTQRGNNRQDIFLTDDDRRVYIDLLRQKCEQFGVALLGYCIMTNHVHFIAVPHRGDSLAKALGQTHWRYAMRFNRRYRRSGHLWQNRFYSSPLGPSHLLAALAYVDLNPVRAGLVGDAAEYPWSSARAHLEGLDQLRLLDDWEWSEYGLQADWAATLRTGPSDEQAAGLRAATANGLAVGDEDFIAKLERISGRPLRSRKHGPAPGGPKTASAAAGLGVPCLSRSAAQPRSAPTLSPIVVALNHAPSSVPAEDPAGGPHSRHQERPAYFVLHRPCAQRSLHPRGVPAIRGLPSQRGLRVECHYVERPYQ